jgi:hypothetical protein
VVVAATPAVRNTQSKVTTGRHLALAAATTSAACLQRVGGGEEGGMDGGEEGGRGSGDRHEE